MAVIRDMMPAFELFQPTSVDEALDLLEVRDDTWVMAGGLDSMDWFKDRIKRPAVVVELGAVDELKGIRTSGEGLEIGAMTSLRDIAASGDVRSRFGLLASTCRFPGPRRSTRAGPAGISRSALAAPVDTMDLNS